MMATLLLILRTLDALYRIATICLLLYCLLRSTVVPPTGRLRHY
jgi:hypothetical protein